MRKFHNFTTKDGCEIWIAEDAVQTVRNPRYFEIPEKDTKKYTVIEFNEGHHVVQGKLSAILEILGIL